MLITIADVDNLQEEDFKLHREHGREDYLFVLYKSPTMVFVNGEYITVSKNQGIMFDKRKIQSYFPVPPNKLLHDYIHFDLETDFEKMIFADIPLGVPINFSMSDFVSNSIANIKKELNNSFSKYKADILSSLGLIFLYRIKSFVDYGDINIKKRDNFKILYNLRKEIYRNPQEEWTIDGICGKIGISRSYLQHQYKEFFSVSCMGDVISARISKAKDLLLCSNLKVGEIAERCGYSNITHFIKQFKSVMGVSPDKFRSE